MMGHLRQLDWPLQKVSAVRRKKKDEGTVLDFKKLRQKMKCNV